MWCHGIGYVCWVEGLDLRVLLFLWGMLFISPPCAGGQVQGAWL